VLGNLDKVPEGGINIENIQLDVQPGGYGDAPSDGYGAPDKEQDPGAALMQEMQKEKAQ